MVSAGVYLKQFATIVRTEVLVLPSRVIVVLFFLVLLGMPLVSQNPYLIRVIILTSIFAILAASWDLLSGFTGQMNFGHALFFGMGAYTSALLNIHFAIPPWGSVPLGALAAVLTGLIIGIPCLRLKGTYLALTTMAFPIILMGIVFALPDLTGGELGISGLQRLSNSLIGNYYIYIVTMLVLCSVMWKITDSHTGIIFHAIREDELAVKASGINTTRYKLMAFCLSGFFAGISGGLYAHYMRIAGPSTLEVSMSFSVVIWAVFGGLGDHLRTDSSGIRSFSAPGICPLLARVSHDDLCRRRPANPPVHARGFCTLGEGQDGKGMPPVQNQKRSGPENLPGLYRTPGLKGFRHEQ